jgi:tRNA A-37 threonylcarbamoyl transferase component Bud32
MNDVGEEHFADELKPGTQLLLGQFTIESFLNAGGFGITYLAKDSLDRRVVIKECFPSSFCRRTGNAVGARTRQREDEFRSIVKLFLQEASNLSKLDHPYIVKVHQVFEDNETAYMAMDYIQGPDLLHTVEGVAPPLQPDQIISILCKMLESLGYVHDQGMLHRDISPDNILLDRFTGNPVLIDFGASKKEITRKSRALSGLRVVKDGYSPQEFYIAGSKQAACSDLYALAASFYHLITAETPKTSQERLSAIANREADPHRPLSGRCPAYPPQFLAAIDKAMSIFPRDRIQDVAEWQAMLRGMPVAAAPLGLAEGPAVPGAEQPRAISAPQAHAVAAARLARTQSVPPAIRPVAQAAAPVPAVEAAEAVIVADAPFAMTRTVALPFVPAQDEPNRVGALLPGSSAWLEIGQRIVEVNGVVVQDGSDLQAMMVAGANLADASELKETLPVVGQLKLSSGLTFETLETPTGVQTRVAAIPAGEETDLRPGDILLVYSATGETIGTGGALADILAREMAADVEAYGFAVQRDGGTTDATFRLLGAD